LSPQVVPTGMEVNKVDLYVADTTAVYSLDCYEEFAIAGGRDATQWRHAFIQIFRAGNETEQVTNYPNRVRSPRLPAETDAANTEQIKPYKIELYLESMELEYNERCLR